MMHVVRERQERSGRGLARVLDQGFDLRHRAFAHATFRRRRHRMGQPHIPGLNRIADALRDARQPDFQGRAG
jgi:hypothetical protein